MSKKNWLQFFKKYHKYPSLVLSLFILLFAVSGIVLNHRQLFSSLDVNRSVLPEDYHYTHWNKAAVKGSVQLAGDTAVIYGNIGAWKTHDNYQTFQDFNQGLPEGMDNRKVERMLKTSRGELYAGTLFGLYRLKSNQESWQKVSLPVKEERIVDLLEVKDSLYVMTRSHILVGDCAGRNFKVIVLPAPDDYDGKMSLFLTLWQIHSGEVFGTLGQLFVDFLGLVFIALALSGLVYFFFPGWIRRRKRKQKPVIRKARFLKFNLKWHNRLGAWLLGFLIVLTFTGMFLRPPLLIAIANSRVDKLPYTHLDNPNPWFDQLRRLLYDEELDRFLIATAGKVYYSDDHFTGTIRSYSHQPPISVMGVNVFEKLKSGDYLVGSFSGIFRWIPEKTFVMDYITRRPHVPLKTMGPPISAHPIAGYLKDANGQEILFDYNLGAGNLTSGNGFTPMPRQIAQSSFSLWNLALEIHTARFYRIFFGKYYILFIPLAGLTILFILITGYMAYRLGHRKKRKGRRVRPAKS
ncbi:MAG: PepSY domain-containing protein [Marinifilaceae bacterium]